MLVQTSFCFECNITPCGVFSESNSIALEPSERIARSANGLHAWYSNARATQLELFVSVGSPYGRCMCEPPPRARRTEPLDLSL